MNDRDFIRASAILALIFLAVAWPIPEAGATPSTHIWSPSTDVQPFGTLHATSDLYVPVERAASGAHVPTVTNLGITAGVLPLESLSLEAGVDHKTGYGDLDSYPLYLNAKLGTPEGILLSLMPALAAGIYDVGTKQDRTDFNVLYVKAAKTLGPAGRISIGYFQGNSAVLRDADGDEDNAGVMAAWERTMSEISDRLWLCVDYMGTKSAYGALSVGGSWKLADAMALIVGVDIFNDDRISPATVTIQADVDFTLGSGSGE